jgi:CheY-like chemotaxis protein
VQPDLSQDHRPCLRLVEPAHPSAASTARGRRWHPASRSSADRPILYICGDPEGRTIFTRIARRWDDTRLVVTDDGCTGVQVAIKRRPRLVVLDDDLPDVNGLALVEHLRQRVLSSDTPVVVLSHDASA